MENIPNDRRYAETHEWALLEGDVVTVGISDHAQHALGDIVYVEAPDTGQQLTAEDDCCVVESVKAASDIYAPVSGEVVAVNNAVVDDPQSINKDPYGSWIFKIKVSDSSEYDALSDASAYKEMIAE